MMSLRLLAERPTYYNRLQNYTGFSFMSVKAKGSTISCFFTFARHANKKSGQPQIQRGVLSDIFTLISFLKKGNHGIFFFNDWSIFNKIKFRYYEKATKFEKSIPPFLKLFSKIKTKWQILANFCCLLRLSDFDQRMKLFRVLRDMGFQASFNNMSFKLDLFQSSIHKLSNCQRLSELAPIIITYI